MPSGIPSDCTLGMPAQGQKVPRHNEKKPEATASRLRETAEIADVHALRVLRAVEEIKCGSISELDLTEGLKIACPCWF
ncbi:hypothetical protein [Dyella jiangningensis]|uniref:hypothetical protein n=1 Tax=Dyella jiangningensis TaxID=1379159 RepID=UPI0011BDF049|nr:hypothetical protein [Dyella jiangningensis]